MTANAFAEDVEKSRRAGNECTYQQAGFGGELYKTNEKFQCALDWREPHRPSPSSLSLGRREPVFFRAALGYFMLQSQNGCF